MIEVKGKYNTARIFTETCDEATVSQVRNLMNQPSVEGAKVRIMPDCHAGAGCVIGTTMTITDKVIPNLVGVDIGCGMLATKLKEQRINLPKFDSVSQAEVPSGMRVRTVPHSLADSLSAEDLACYRKSGCKVDPDIFRLSLGTLGGGNHFWELDRDEEDNIWLVVHTGSRRSGKDVAEYYQKLAYESLNLTGRKRKQEISRQREAFIEQIKAEGRETELSRLLRTWKPSLPEEETSVPYEVAWCEGELFDDYIHDMKIMQVYAALNRRIITETILKKCKLHAVEQFETVHNYIDTDRMILRKGSVSARQGEKLLIPINMRDGALICIGKGNPDWNESAPHGAGRLMSRSAARSSISMKDYRESMAGIFTTCVNKATLDESPMAYKPIGEIIANIEPTVEIVSHIRPIYNYKAGEET
ncbi:MAG: RtcB family protein [Eubacteriales bacterium]|nr:RtcB family protein [Eubacteriales bacterium]